MKYFTREELEDITSELLINPTRETLEILNQKYNSSSEVKKDIIGMKSPIIETIPNTVSINTVAVEPISPNADVNSSLSSEPNLNIPSEEISKTQNISSNSGNETISLELPKLDPPVFENQNNHPVTFNGNLWEPPQSNMENLMQTTDNFASTTNVVPNTEVLVTGAPFFGPNKEQVNNPIPVGGSSPSGPTMFGQFEQNYM